VYNLISVAASRPCSWPRTSLSAGISPCRRAAWRLCGRVCAVRWKPGALTCGIWTFFLPEPWAPVPRSCYRT